MGKIQELSSEARIRGSQDPPSLPQHTKMFNWELMGKTEDNLNALG
jgi:hypothetical protein